MKNLVRNSLILIILMVCAILAITPPETKLRLGKDLAGGVSLIYGVDVPPGETGVLNKVIDVVKERLDPNGVMEIGIVAQGNDRIEITMPLPTNDVKALKEVYEDKLKALSVSELSQADFDVLAAKPAAERTAEVARIAAGDTKRLETINAALASYDAVKPALAELAESQRTLKQVEKLLADARAAGKPADDTDVRDLTTARDAAKAAYAAAAEKAAPLQIKYENERADALKGGVDPNELRRALVLANKPIVIRGGGPANRLPPPRETAVEEIKRAHPEALAKIDDAIAAWNDYEAKRRTLDDPQDIVRILRGAGVLNFRIVVNVGTFAQENAARQEIQTLGPRAAQTDRVRWFKINKIQNWVDSVEQLKAIESPEGARAHFASRYRMIVERYRGEFFMLCWDEPGFRLTEDDGNWQVAKSSAQPDQFGRPGIGFEMDAAGASKLGELTRNNVNKPMAVLLDDEVYTAPNLNSAISRNGIIEGNFNTEELEYIIRVLSAGSLQARLSPEPISSTILAPTLGADNLKKGLDSGIIAFIVVGVFMIGYYFVYGVVAMIALAVNALLLVACMALNQAAFTLPGIAGVVLTFGQAVDANVLIYERIREELNRGHDMRTAMRLGYQRAMSAIVDGNITTLIVCVVLGLTGTQEIKGFGLTLGIGTVTTLFAQLFVTRLIFTLLVEKLRIRRLSMLTLVFPIIHKWFEPKIDWMRLRFISYGISLALAGMGVFFLATEGRDLLGLDFRGGTAVTINLKDGPDGKPTMMTRAEVEDKLDKLKEMSGGSGGVEVVVVNPDRNDFAKSDTFRIKTLITKPAEVQAMVSEAFDGLIDSRQALKFDNSDAVARTAPIYPLTDPILGDNINDGTVREPVGEYIGGAALMMRNINPPASVNELSDRLREFRIKPDYQMIQSRDTRVVVLAGSPDRVTSAAILVMDPKIDYRNNREVWQADIRDREWSLALAALTQPSTLSSVESFSPSVASSFRNAAIGAVLLSTVMIVIYVWVRFNSFRYSAAAITTTLHDCFVSVGLVAAAGVISRHFPETASALGIMPFKIDLNLVAAILTTLGYSLNDTIIIMDRIRENRGKLPYASRSIINNSINQTISRTVITSGTTVIAVLVLYIYGGEGIRAFSFTMLCGVFVGTYSSIAVAAPLVWSAKADPRSGTTPSPELSGTATA